MRELRNVLQRAWVMSAGGEITDQWLPRDQAAQQAAPSGLGTVAATATASALDVASAPAAPSLQVVVGTPLAAVERQVILATLEHFAHHKERTAAALGVSLKTLYNRLKEYSLTDDEAVTAASPLDAAR